MNFPKAFNDLYRFSRGVLINFNNDHCLEFAGSLAFSTLLSIIPVAIVVVWILSGFEEMTRMSLQAQDFVLEHLVPEAAAGVRQYILDLSHRSRSIPHYGIAFLLITSILLLYAVDASINRIWKADTSHRRSLRALIYILILVFVPILLGLSLLLLTFIAKLPFLNLGPNYLHLDFFLLNVNPFFLTTIMLTLLFKYTPRVHVRLKFAVVGAVVAALLFEISKYVFSWYIRQFPNYEMVYGALSVLPIFLIWIYLSWCIILLGVEISYCYSTGHNDNNTTVKANNSPNPNEKGTSNAE